VRLVGREEERRRLLAYAGADEPHFIVVYGRRRVGKTFLVREVFDDRFCFSCTGLARGPKGDQLRAFAVALNAYGGRAYPQAADWFEAFQQLRDLVERAPAGKKVIFLDEMPWMDTHRSGFTTALEWFWNGWASGRRDVLLIVCGSASAWLTRKLFRDRGGLYNRVTGRLGLRPWTLGECEEYCAARGIVFDRLQMVESYMVFGGIPYYLSLLDRGLSLAQNVDALCFAPDGQLKGELGELYDTLFAQPERHLDVVTALAAKTKGLTRRDIVGATRLTDGGGLTKVLAELEQSHFVRAYAGFRKKERDTIYQLSDPFSRFALKFMRGASGQDERFWSTTANSAGRNAWRGLAFEQVCLAHVPQIKHALGISGVHVGVSSWRGRAGGGQIDLVLDRDDRVVNLVEIKFSDEPYAITKAYDADLRARRAAFRDETGTTKALHQTFVTTYGLKHNAYWGNVQSEATMADLFRGL